MKVMQFVCTVPEMVTRTLIPALLLPEDKTSSLTPPKRSVLYTIRERKEKKISILSTDFQTVVMMISYAQGGIIPQTKHPTPPLSPLCRKDPLTLRKQVD